MTKDDLEKAYNIRKDAAQRRIDFIENEVRIHAEIIRAYSVEAASVIEQNKVDYEKLVADIIELTGVPVAITEAP